MQITKTLRFNKSTYILRKITSTRSPTEQFGDLFLYRVPVSELLYVGHATERKLARYGIHTIGELAVTPPDTLKTWFGINGLKLWQYASGADTPRIMPYDYSSPVKSVGHGITCTADLLDNEEVWRVMLELSQDVGHRLRIHGLSACGVQVTIRSKELDFQQYQCKLPARTQLPMEIAQAGFRLFASRYFWSEPVRAVTVRAIDLIPSNSPEQFSLFIDNEKREKKERLQDSIEEIRRRFGNKAITYATLMDELKMPCDGRDKVRMPSVMYQ